MSTQRSTDTGSVILPVVILFGGLTLLLIGLLAARPNIAPVKMVEATTSPIASTQVAEAVTVELTQAAQVVQSTVATLDPAIVKAGEANFQGTCSACHGFNAMGIPGLGKPLIGSKFVNRLTDDQLLAFLQVGRPVTDPLNTTGAQMPARGGNPSFTDDKLREIIAYIRSLNETPSASTTVATTSAPVVTDVPGTFAPPDLSGLAVPTSISGSDAGTNALANTAVPTEAATAESTVEPFTPTDLSGLAAPTSIAHE